MNISTLDLLGGIGKVGSEGAKKTDVANSPSFEDTLKKSINELNELQHDKNSAMSDIASGEVKNLHQAAMAIDKAELSMKLALEIRNKAIQAYKELLKTQI